MARHAIALVPHITEPYPDDRSPNHTDLLRTGAYNLGCLGLSQRPDTRAFLAWWRSVLYDGCLVDPDRGLFVDQKWIDLVPALFPDHAIVRDRALDVAYWNLHERRLCLEGDTFTANGAPIAFFHFSGFDPGSPERLSRYSDRSSDRSHEAVRVLCEAYAALVHDAGHREVRCWPPAYGAFDNGVPIADLARRAYRLFAPPERAAHPFAVGAGTFHEWLTEAAAPGSSLTRFASLLPRLHHGLAVEFRGGATRDEARFAARVREMQGLLGLAATLIECRTPDPAPAHEEVDP
jgi:hypothetical protein